MFGVSRAIVFRWRQKYDEGGPGRTGNEEDPGARFATEPDAGVAALRNHHRMRSAARAAVLQHLDAIVDLEQRTIDGNPQALLDLSDHLQALIDITRDFGERYSHCTQRQDSEGTRVMMPLRSTFWSSCPKCSPPL